MASHDQLFLPRLDTTLTQTSTTTIHHTPTAHSFLILFDTESGSSRMTYMLIDSTGKGRNIVPKTNSKAAPKISGCGGYKVAVLDNNLYVIGGRHLISGVVLRQCYKYNPVINRWMTIAKLNYARTRHTATVLDGYIYVCGGETKSGSFTESVEVYDPLLNQWSEVRDMPEPRANHAACVCEGKLYVTGGLGPTSGPNINFWQYDPITDFWIAAQNKTQLPRPKERHTMLAHRGKVYILGGVTTGKKNRMYVDVEDNRMASFDCSKCSSTPQIVGFWDRSHPDMSLPRCQAGIVLVGHHIFHMGGKLLSTGKNEITVEDYNIRRKSWRDSFKLPRSFSSMEACVLRVPTTNTDFSTLGLAMSNRWVMW